MAPVRVALIGLGDIGSRRTSLRSSPTSVRCSSRSATATRLRSARPAHDSAVTFTPRPTPRDLRRRERRCGDHRDAAVGHLAARAGGAASGEVRPRREADRSVAWRTRRSSRRSRRAPAHACRSGSPTGIIRRSSGRAISSVPARSARPVLLRVTGYDGDATTGSALGELVLGHLAHGMPIVHEGAHFCDWASMILGADPVELTGLRVQDRSGVPRAQPERRDGALRGRVGGAVRGRVARAAASRRTTSRSPERSGTSRSSSRRWS